MMNLSGLRRYITKEACIAFIIGIAVIGTLFFTPEAQGSDESNREGVDSQCEADSPLCDVLTSEGSAVRSIAAIVEPKIKTPAWLVEKKKQEERANRQVVTYTVRSHGSVRTDIDSFAGLAAETFDDERGWSRLGVRFERVQEGGQFNLILSEAAKVTDFSADGCDTTYSCRVGDSVIINEDRWLGATDPWNAAGGALRDYQHMVVNHETGHWLGHSHYYCSGAGNPAPVMQQQSMDLQGCTFNPWPVDFELTSSQLGI